MKRKFIFLVAACVLLASGYLIGRRASSEIVKPQVAEPKPLALDADGFLVRSREYREAYVREHVEHSKNGEYVLMFETPTQRLWLQGQVNKRVAAARNPKDPAYADEFAALGVPENVSQQLRNHVWKVFRASVELEAMQQQYLKAQSDYEKKVRSVLSSEKYAQYRRFEKTKFSEREYAEFERFAAMSNITLDQSTAEEVKRVILDSGAFTFHFNHGPYDGMPNVSLGKDAAILRLDEEMAATLDASKRFQAAALKDGLNEAARKALEKYYLFRVEGMEAHKSKIVSRSSLWRVNSQVEDFGSISLPALK